MAAPVLKDPPPPEECPDCGQEYQIVDRIDWDAQPVFTPTDAPTCSPKYDGQPMLSTPPPDTQPVMKRSEPPPP